MPHEWLTNSIDLTLRVAPANRPALLRGRGPEWLFEHCFSPDSARRIEAQPRKSTGVPGNIPVCGDYIGGAGFDQDCGRPYREFESHSLRHLDRRRMLSARVCGVIEPNSGTDFSCELWIPSRQGALVILRKAHLSPKLWTPQNRYGARISNVSRGFRTSIKIGSATPLGRARASESNSPYRGLNPPAPASQSCIRAKFCNLQLTGPEIPAFAKLPETVFPMKHVRTSLSLHP
jgi:hypothetical protein